MTGKMVKCKICGLAFEEATLEFQGAVVFRSVMCDPCIEKREKEHKKAQAEKAKARENAEMTKLWERTCPAYYRDFNPDLCPASEESRGLLRGNIKAMNLYLYGGSGSGKTFLAWQVAKHRAFHQGEDVATATGMDFRELYYPLTDEREKAEQSARMKSLKTCKLLLFDDIGQMVDSEAGSERMFALIEWRIKNNKATIMTSNYKPEQLEGRFRPEPLAKALSRRIQDYYATIKINKKTA